MDFVEDDDAHTREFGVALKASREDAFGDDLDPGVGADVAFVAGLISDEPAHTGPGQCRHPSCGSPRGETNAARASRCVARRARLHRGGRSERPSSFPHRGAPRGSRGAARPRRPRPRGGRRGPGGREADAGPEVGPRSRRATRAVVQPSAGEPRNGTGSPEVGSSIDDHLVIVAIASQTTSH